MSDWQHFKSLLTKYLNNVATADEQDELMRLISTGRHDDVLKETFDKTLQEPEATYYDMRPERAREIFRNIVRFKNDSPDITAQDRRKPWRWVAAAASLLLISTAAFWVYKSVLGGDEVRVRQQVAQVAKETSVFSGKQFVRFPDGSTAILNEGSQLSYASSFGNETREVILVGEAYFDIQHDPEHPFKVRTGDVTTTVLGTAFNVKAFPDQGEIKVTVTRGKVQVANKEKTLGIIIPDQEIAVNTKTDEYTQVNTKAEEVVAWKSKYMLLDDVSLEAAAVMIEDKYNTKIIFENSELKKCRINARFYGEEIEQILSVISIAVGGEYNFQPDGTVKLNGKGCQ